MMKNFQRLTSFLVIDEVTVINEFCFSVLFIYRIWFGKIVFFISGVIHKSPYNTKNILIDTNNNSRQLQIYQFEHKNFKRKRKEIKL